MATSDGGWSDPGLLVLGSLAGGAKHGWAITEDIAATMSVRGFAVEGIEPVGDNDAVLDFEIMANRPEVSVSRWRYVPATCSPEAAFT